MNETKNKFWIDSPSVIFDNLEMLPNSGMNLSEQINSLTRLVIVVFVIMAMINFTTSFYFFVIAIFVLIILCYVQRKRMESKKIKENFSNGINYQSRGNVGSFNAQFPNMKTEHNDYFAWNGLTSGVVGYEPTKLQNLAPTVKSGNKNFIDTLIETPQALTFCNDEVNIDPPNHNAVSINQNLAGKAGQLTKIPPVVIAPSHDLSYWRDNEFIVHSAINSEGIQKDMYLSGYAESDCCGYVGNQAVLEPVNDKYKNVYVGGNLVEGYSKNCSLNQKPSNQNFCAGNQNVYPTLRTPIVAPSPAVDIPFIPTMTVPEYDTTKRLHVENYAKNNSNVNCYLNPTPNNQNFCSGNLNRYPRQSNPIVAPSPAVDTPFIPSIPVPAYSRQKQPNFSQPVIKPQKQFYENFDNNYTRLTTSDNQEQILQYPGPGWINTECSYNPSQVKVNLPSNFPAGNCQQNERMSQFNKNLFTQIVTPGVYTVNQVNEPINSNIGISFQQQFEPVTCKQDENGLTYTQHDPSIVEPALEQEIESYNESPNYDNVTDPRFWGYGTSYRSYLDENLGQTKFMYDDVNAIRHPNYIVRSKIDFLPYADSYGPVPENGEEGNVHNPYIRALVQDAWLRNSIQFRNDITERRMRKINANKWQQRLAPLGPRQVGS